VAEFAPQLTHSSYDLLELSRPIAAAVGGSLTRAGSAAWWLLQSTTVSKVEALVAVMGDFTMWRILWFRLSSTAWFGFQALDWTFFDLLRCIGAFDTTVYRIQLELIGVYRGTRRMLRTAKTD